MSGNDAFQTSIFDGTEQSTLEQSLRLIRAFEEPSLHRNPIGYAVGYSGGKDSDALLHLFKIAGVKFFVFHNHTTLDAPESIQKARRGRNPVQNLYAENLILGALPSKKTSTDEVEAFLL